MKKALMSVSLILFLFSCKVVPPTPPIIDNSDSLTTADTSDTNTLLAVIDTSDTTIDTATVRPMVAYDMVGANMSSPAYAGVTVGGSQDIGYFRNLVESGSIPDTSVLTCEGLFSEHDFPIEVSSSQNLLNVTPAAAQGILPGDTVSRTLVQLVMSSNIEMSAFRHEKTKLICVVDRSGSMGGSADGGSETKMTVVKEMLTAMLDSLRGDDQVGIISFNSTWRIDTELQRVDEGKDNLAAAISSIYEGGSTDIESALRKGFEILAAEPEEGYKKRVLLFTDERPNTGNTGTDDFLSLTETYADSGIGMTAFGVGLDFGADLAKSVSEVKGGNYVYLADAEAIENVVTEDLEFLLTPIAYDFSLNVSETGNYALTNVYGMPGGTDEEFSMSAKTLFLSRNKGAIALEFAGSGTGVIATITLAYTRASDNVQITLPVQVHTGMLHYENETITYSHNGVIKIVALTGMVIGTKRAIGLYLDGNSEAAAALLDTVANGLTAAAAFLPDTTLLKESDLVLKLKENILASDWKPEEPDSVWIDTATVTDSMIVYPYPQRN